MSGRPTEPGWYDDPVGDDSDQRYWDGQRWPGEARQPEARSVSLWLKGIGLTVLAYLVLATIAEFLWSLLGWSEPQSPVYLAALAISIGATWLMSRSGRLGGFPVGRLWLILFAIVVFFVVALMAVYHLFISEL